MEIQELKVKAYDLLATIDQAKMMLQQVNQEIARQLQPQPKVEKPKEVKEEPKPEIKEVPTENTETKVE